MGIYTNRLIRESEGIMDGIIQQPGSDAGVDLDAVEKAIVGDDSEKNDEVKDATSGVIGDPVDEAYTAMYESQYNYNQIMRVIGLSEVSAASIGKEVVLEGADIKGFFEKAKEIILNLFKHVTEAFKKALMAMTQLVMADKKFVEKYKDKIIAGANTDWEAKGYIYGDFSISKDAKTYDIIKYAQDVAENKHGNESMNAFVINMLSGTNASDISGMRKELEKKIRNGEESPIDISNKYTSNEVINILIKDDDVKTLKESFNFVKKTYKETLNSINTMKSAALKQDKDADISNYNKAIKAITFAANVMNVRYAVLVTASRERRALARKLARLFVVKANESNGGKQEVQHNSASMMFGGIQLV